MHVVLLGDSTLDNRWYTDGGPSVTDHLRVRLGAAHTVTLLAVDGDTTDRVTTQLRDAPDDATHLVLSVGGNDALGYIDILARPAASVSDAIAQLAVALTEFEGSYQTCLDAVLARGLPTVVCTIYNGAFPDRAEQEVITTTVRLFDDVIIQRAMEAGCPVVDLRRVCTEPDDYWDPIEPNEKGGAKIAAAIASAVSESS